MNPKFKGLTTRDLEKELERRRDAIKIVEEINDILSILESKTRTIWIDDNMTRNSQIAVGSTKDKMRERITATLKADLTAWKMEILTDESLHSVDRDK